MMDATFSDATCAWATRLRNLVPMFILSPLVISGKGRGIVGVMGNAIIAIVDMFLLRRVRRGDGCVVRELLGLQNMSSADMRK